MPKQTSKCPQPLLLTLRPVVIFGLMALLSGAALASVKVTPTESGYDIDIDGEASASEVIDAIASAAGVEIKGQPEETAVAPNNLRNTSIERALRKLFPTAHFAVRFDADDTPEAIIFLSPSQDSSGTDGDDGSDPSGDSPPADEQDEQEDTSTDSGD